MMHVYVAVVHCGGWGVGPCEPSPAEGGSQALGFCYVGPVFVTDTV